MTGAAKGTVLRLLADIGQVCANFHDDRVREINAKLIECDEIWSFCGAKAVNVPKERRGEPGIGDVWTWVGIDAETKLAVSWLVGSRDASTAAEFMEDLADRLANRVQLTTDGLGAYLKATEDAFGWNGVDFAQLVKIYGPSPEGAVRYSPPVCVGSRKEAVMGKPQAEHVSTSFVERQNLTMRMQMRRFTRLTNGFSKKIENHVHAIALHFVHYNWCRPHQTLTKAARGVHTSPAMAAGLTNRIWKLEDLVGLLDSN